MTTVLSMSSISKSFPGVKALQSVDFDLRKGEVHALVGENGAGKSTLMKILAGIYTADEGEIRLKDKIIVPTGAKSMLDAGVSVIYQELNLVPQLSISENIFLGREPMKKNGLIDWSTLHRDVAELLKPFRVQMDPRAKVYTIGPAYQQLVEIAKALSLRSDILVMDEPTAPLTGNEVEQLFVLINDLKAKGVSIIYISHRLEEIQRIADRVTVLRDGQHIITADLAELPINEIVKQMVGRQLEEHYPKHISNIGEEAFRVEGLTKKGVCSDVSFSVRKGEILGFAGLVGAGRTEIMQLLYGYKKRDSGRIFVNGKETSIRNTRDAVNRGIGLIPEERKKQGLVLGLTVLDNSALTILDLHSVMGFIKSKDILGLVSRMSEHIGVKTPSLKQTVRNLSGGNQQKVVLSKWFVRDCAIYIFDEPTRGIDVGAKVEIYKLMQALADNGAAVIMISSDLPEIMNLSDRILAIYDGRIVKEFIGGKTTDEEVMSYALGLHEKPSTSAIREGAKV